MEWCWQHVDGQRSKSMRCSRGVSHKALMFPAQHCVGLPDKDVPDAMEEAKNWDAVFCAIHFDAGNLFISVISKWSLTELMAHVWPWLLRQHSMR